MQLELKNIHKAYGDHIIFDDMNIDFSHSGFYLLSGHSGSGKTTLLNMIAGYEEFNLGKRIIQDVRMACIFQSYELIDELTVLENIRMGVDLHHEVFDDTLIKKLGIDEFKNHYPNELSGGQKQRVGIARALYQNPNVILCDEPTESLDIDNKEIVLNLLKEISKDKVVIVACHELSIIDPYYDYHYKICERKLVLENQRRELKKCEIENTSTQYDRSSLKKYLHQIIHKKTFIAVLCFSLMIIVQIGLYTLDQWLFTPKTSLDALNGQVVYVNLFDENPDIIKSVGIKRKPIVAFDPVMIDSKKYKLNIYPLENDSYQLEENEIIINTKTLGLFTDETIETIIGKNMTLAYTIGNIPFEKSYTVKEVVEEKDAYYPQIYYDYDALFESLDLYFQNMLLEESSNYEILTTEENTEKIYQSLKDNPRILTTHSVLDMRKQNEKSITMYHVLFLMIESIALLTTIICILYFNKKDTDKNKTALSLIYSLQVPMEKIKWEYFTQKILYMLIGAISIGIALVIIKNNVAILSLEIAMGYVSLITVIYIISVGYQMVRFKSQDISMILKENKD